MPMASRSMAENIAERIRTAVGQHSFSVRTGKSVVVAISTGIGCFPDDGESTEELLTAASRNMAQDKHTRKNMHNLATMPTPARIDHYT
jgi:diguanylate cyclase (GGDEF)-like protein